MLTADGAAPIHADEPKLLFHGFVVTEVRECARDGEGASRIAMNA
jgi:hypothetical protein